MIRPKDRTSWTKTTRSTLWSLGRSDINRIHFWHSTDISLFISTSLLLLNMQVSLKNKVRETWETCCLIKPRFWNSFFKCQQRQFRNVLPVKLNDHMHLSHIYIYISRWYFFYCVWITRIIKTKTQTKTTHFSYNFFQFSLRKQAKTIYIL